MAAKLRALHIRAYDASPSLTVLAISRGHDRAFVLGIGPFLPVFRIIRPLSMITAVQATKHEASDNNPDYGVSLRVRSGAPVRFGCRSRAQAMKIMRKISEYLGLHHTSH